MNGQKKGAVVFAKALVVLALVAAVGLVVYAKRGSSPGESAGEATTKSSPIITATPQPSPTAQASQPVPLPRLVDLGADKCIPCKAMAPILEELKTTYAGKLKVDFIDVWKDPGAGEKYGINLIPTQIFFDASGKELFRHEGFFAKDDILAKWKDLGFELSVRGAR